jgi:hypothetical protein
MKTNAKNTKKSSPARDTSGSTHLPSARVAAARSTRTGKLLSEQLTGEHAEILLGYLSCIIRYVPPPILAEAMQQANDMAKDHKLVNLKLFRHVGQLMMSQYMKHFSKQWHIGYVHEEPKEKHEKAKDPKAKTPQGQEGVQNGRPTPE